MRGGVRGRGDACGDCKCQSLTALQSITTASLHSLQSQVPSAPRVVEVGEGGGDGEGGRGMWVKCASITHACMM